MSIPAFSLTKCSSRLLKLNSPSLLRADPNLKQSQIIPEKGEFKKTVARKAQQFPTSKTFHSSLKGSKQYSRELHLLKMSRADKK